MAVKAVRQAAKPRAAKRAAKRATRRAARKARRSAKPKAPKAARKATKPRAAKRAAKRVTRKASRKARKSAKPKAPKAVKATKPRAAKRAVRRTKVKKPKRVTRKMQTGSYRKVWNGTAKFTKGGLTKDDLMLNKRGKVVSKKMFKKGQALKGQSGWMKAVMQARKELGITGFCLMNRGAQGVALYKKAKEIYN